MNRTNRRQFLGGLGCAGGLLLLGARPAPAGFELAAAYPTILKFDVTRDGAPLGVVMQRFTPDGLDAITDIYIDFAVGFLGLSLYRYEHRARERWRSQRLVTLDSITNDNGTPQRVAARSGAAGLLVDGEEGRLTAPADILPSSYWHPRFVEQRRMLDSQIGRIRTFAIADLGPDTVTALGRPVACTRYAMRGDVDLDFWYDASRVWQKMRFSFGGSDIEYTRVVPEAADARKFAAPLDDGRTVGSAGSA